MAAEWHPTFYNLQQIHRSSQRQFFRNNSSSSIGGFGLRVETMANGEIAQILRDYRFHSENARFRSMPDLIRDLEHT